MTPEELATVLEEFLASEVVRGRYRWHDDLIVVLRTWATDYLERRSRRSA